MTDVRWPTLLAEREAEFDEPLAALDRLAAYVEPEIALARAPFAVTLGIAGWIGIIAIVCGLGALAYGVFG